ncbi:hypothetical protein CHLNCDRAFT_138913 [Chlorella variabilis]|uniref:SBP-type domain-containing protein n=1 Tax=Chlorella variabilis TaxID=554065 RepID=E1ZNX4_CHLVA|nr:hypothetical protein CHLNCDRAFT_138913 [Chlorella variabilis]EFN52419.1 hypothetical protein CHLNCDRAFT_138913 [Chlorella variabilis]|eukprot:XP_005844521.1 hypothetical protein CHLNCDRAFT_138913 [Chlorella variabilis]
MAAFGPAAVEGPEEALQAGQEAAPAGAAYAAGSLPAPSPDRPVKRKPGRPALHHGCQICGASLDGLKLFHQRYHICVPCMASESVLVKGIQQRFCQQCGRFHELAAFAPTMRSCRKQLAKHAERRRRARELAARAISEAAAATAGGGAGQQRGTQQPLAPDSSREGDEASKGPSDSHIQDLSQGQPAGLLPPAKRSRLGDEPQQQQQQHHQVLMPLPVGRLPELSPGLLPPAWCLNESGGSAISTAMHQSLQSLQESGLDALLAAAAGEGGGEAEAPPHRPEPLQQLPVGIPGSAAVLPAASTAAPLAPHAVPPPQQQVPDVAAFAAALLQATAQLGQQQQQQQLQQQQQQQQQLGLQALQQVLAPPQQQQLQQQQQLDLQTLQQLLLPPQQPRASPAPPALLQSVPLLQQPAPQEQQVTAMFEAAIGVLLHGILSTQPP